MMAILDSISRKWIRVRSYARAFSLLDLENGQYGRNNNEEGSIDEVPPRANSFSEPKC